ALGGAAAGPLSVRAQAPGNAGGRLPQSCKIWYSICQTMSDYDVLCGNVNDRFHFNCSMTVPSEIVGRATPVLLAFLAIHSRADRVLSSAPALSCSFSLAEAEKLTVRSYSVKGTKTLFDLYEQNK